MNYRLRNSAGIGTLSVLVIIIVLVVIVFTVEMVNNARSIKEANPTTNSQAAKDVRIPKTAEMADWKEQVDTDFGYAYAFPADKNWESYRTTTSKDSDEYKQGMRINTAGVNYTGCGKNCGLVFTMLVFAKDSEADPGKNWAPDLMSTNSYYQLSSKTAVKKNGTSGTRWEYKAPDSTVAPLVFYYFNRGSYTYAIQVNANGAVAENIDLTKEGEKIFSTFTFIGND